MADPQQIVDDALAANPASTMPSLPPEPAPTTPPPTPPTPSPAPPVMTPPPASAVPTVTTTTTTTSVPMGDETPLAFVTPPPAPAPLPPVESQPSPSSAPINIDTKPKKPGSKVLMTLLGVFALLAALAGGGYYAYQQFGLGGQSATVAVISQADCGKCNATGYVTRWDNQRNECRATNTKCVGGNDGVGGQPPASPVSSETDPNTCTRNGGAWCAGCGGFCNVSNNQTCDQLQVTKCGQAVLRGASCSLTTQTGYFKQCTCDGRTVYFNADGSCESRTGTNVNADGTIGTSDGLCQVYRNSGGSCGAADSVLTGGAAQLYSCDNNGCYTTDAGYAAGYRVYKYTCTRITNLGGGCLDNKSGAGKSQTFSGACGSQQIDVELGAGTPVAFKSKINASACGTVTASSSPGAPTMACTSLTKNVVDSALALNTAVTLTCLGAVVPATTERQTISYEFRYMVGTGAWQNLTTVAGNTASLTPTQCGVEYTAQCRACATISGVRQCDPVWQGVAP